MANKIETTSTAKTKQTIPTLFNKENYMLMIAGLVILALGFFLMAGGKSKDPNVFDPKEVYSTTRITIAPILIILGFLVEVFAIMKKPKTETNN
jgi:heme/copper-type cytochrome/quinol oxidase subunit 2